MEDFLDPVSGGDPAKEDLLAFLEANWGTSPGATQPDAQPEEDVASRVSSSPTCRPVDFHKSKTNSFPLASEHFPHNSMGASA
eukprot:SAG25_NODE_12525_length_279_cov_0.566667_1_plen_82_part_01